MAIEIVDFPIKHGGSFRCYVSSPEGMSWYLKLFFPTKNLIWSSYCAILLLSWLLFFFSDESWFIHMYLYIYIYRHMFTFCLVKMLNVYAYESKPWHPRYPKIAGQWMFIPPNLGIVGFDASPYELKWPPHIHKTLHSSDQSQTRSMPWSWFNHLRGIIQFQGRRGGSW